MTNAKNTIRKAKNSVNLKGELISMEKRDVTVQGDKEALSLNLDIDVGNNNIIPVSMFATKLNKKGEVSGFYKGIKTIIEEYKTRQEDEDGNVINMGEMVTIRSSGDFAGGSVDINEYYGKNGLNTNLQVKGSFVNRVRPGEENLENGVEFVLEGYISKMARGTDENGEFDGTMTITLLSPDFSGKISEFELLVENPEFTDSIENIYEVGDTATFIGEFMHKIETTVKKTRLAFGGNSEGEYEDVATKVKKGLLVTGGDMPRKEGEPNAYTKEEMEMAMKERELHLESLKQKFEAKEKKATNPTAGSFGGGAKVGAGAPMAEIPF